VVEGAQGAATAPAVYKSVLYIPVRKYYLPREVVVMAEVGTVFGQFESSLPVNGTYDGGGHGGHDLGHLGQQFPILRGGEAEAGGEIPQRRGRDWPQRPH
jgi:hypothetical protein